MAAAPSFSLTLSFAVPADELRAWLDGAEPGARTVYAHGIDLPRGSEAAVLVGQWVRDGRATTHQRRDPADARRWQFLVEARSRRAWSGPAGARVADAAPGVVPSREMKSLLVLLVACATQGLVLPSNAALADQLGLAGERGRMRAKYLLARAQRDGLIRVDKVRGQRVATILADGRGQGLSTAAPQPGRRG